MNVDNLLDQGAFGCVYYPGLKCDGTFSKETKKISKLQKDGIESENEYKISNILKKNVKNHNLYFSIITSKCKIKIKEIKEDLTTCNIYEKLKNRNVDDFTLMEQSYINHQKIISYFIKLNISSDNKFIIELITGYKHLCHGVDNLINNNVVHYDLHSSNIIFDLNRQIPIIIDFGLSINFNEIKDITESNVNNLSKYFYIHAPSQTSWCYEIHILNYLLNKTNILTKETLKTLLDEITNSNVALKELFSPFFLNKYKKLLYNYYEKYVNKNKVYVIKELLKSHYYWDIFSISLIFLRIIHLSYNKKHLNDPIYKMFVMILFDNIHPNPYKRNTPIKTVNRLITDYDNSISQSNLKFM